MRAHAGASANTPSINANPFSTNPYYRVLTKYVLLREIEINSKFIAGFTKVANVLLTIAEVLAALDGFLPSVGAESLKFDQIDVLVSYTFQVVLAEQFPSTMYYDSAHRLIVQAGETKIIAVKNAEQDNVEIFTGAIEPMETLANSIVANIKSNIQDYATSYMAAHFPKISYTMG